MVEDGTALDMVAPTPMVLCLYDDKDLGSRLTALDERCLLPVKQEVSYLLTSIQLFVILRFDQSTFDDSVFRLKEYSENSTIT